jgi:hypothetical protein
VADTEKAYVVGVEGDKASRIIEEWRSMRADQEQWRSELWQRISDYVMPRKSEINTKKTKSIDGYTDRIYDTTAIHANTTLAAGSMDFLIGGRWFANKAPDKDAPASVQEWYKRTGEIMLEVLAETNFEMEIHSFFVMRGGFGTAHLHVEEDDDDILYCKSEDIGTYVIAENAKGVVDKVMILKEYTPRQLIQLYEEKGTNGNTGNIPKIVYERAKMKDKDKKDDKIQVIVAIEPRPSRERDPDKIDALNMPIRTCHVMIEGGVCLRESGYPEMPTMVSRWAEWGDEVYGYCPSVEVLSGIRQLNFIEENLDTLVEVKVNPRLLYPSNLEGDVDLRAGGVTIYDEGMSQALPQEWATAGDVRDGMERSEFRRRQIEQSYFTDLFQLLTSMSERGREKTAFEVAEMLSEKVGRFHPTFTRLNTEFSKPFLNRVFGICFRKGLFPEPPEGVFREKSDGSLVIDTPKVEFTSKIAMLLKARQNQDFLQFLQVVMQTAQIDPDGAAQQWRMMFNPKRGYPKLADNLGVATDFLNTDEEIKAIEDQMAEEAQQQQAMQAMESGAKAAGQLGSAPQELQDSIGDQL